LPSLCLLIGAGFSRNWGGWLSEEVFEHLLGNDNIIRDSQLQEHMWNHKNNGGFEAALFKWRSRTDISKERKIILESAIKDTFDSMNKGLRRSNLEFSQDRLNSISLFLTKFDVIFTLNQDLFLEYHYMNSNIELNAPQRFNGPALPGMLPEHPVQLGSWADTDWLPNPREEFSVSEGAQPIIKLHGSSNWISNDSERLMIMGGAKSSQISSIPILSYYLEYFRNSIYRENSKLMIIGYSFSDNHINDALSEAVNKGLHLFIIDPRGTSLVYPDLYEFTSGKIDLRNGLRGASRRNLRETFSGDAIEMAKIQRFIDFLR
jgi:hypothetical protein